MALEQTARHRKGLGATSRPWVTPTPPDASVTGVATASIGAIRIQTIRAEPRTTFD